MRNKQEPAISFKGKLVITTSVLFLAVLIVLSFLPVSPETQPLQVFSKYLLMIIGKTLAWMLFIVMSFVGESIFQGAQSIKGQFLGVSIQIISIVAMSLPYALITGWNGQNGFAKQLGAVSTIAAMIWLISWYQDKKIVKILKGEN